MKTGFHFFTQRGPGFYERQKTELFPQNLPIRGHHFGATTLGPPLFSILREPFLSGGFT
jgi:hypothetical protein